VLTRGLCLAFGQSERRPFRWALVVLLARPANSARKGSAPAQDEEFVMSHSDTCQATGFFEHLKLPHYVDLVLAGLFRKRVKEFAGGE